MSKTIAINDSGEISFTMPDDNVTILPVFYDTTSVYKLDYTNVANGEIPEGWRCMQENNDVHQYPNTYSSGARTLKDFQGYQGKGLYWRNGRAEYGSLNNYKLNLEPGEYKVTFAMAAWKGDPKYSVVIRNADTNTDVAQSEEFGTAVNVNGNTSADVSAEPEHEFKFTIPEKGNYIIRFSDKSTYGGYHEFLLLSCKLNNVGETGVESVMDGGCGVPAGIYSPQGIRLSSMQSGLNIVIEADGTVKKVMKK